MKINYKICKQEGHEKFLATHICIFYDCKILKRQCCLQCINYGIHVHDKLDLGHIIYCQEILKMDKEIEGLKSIIEEIQESQMQITNYIDLKQRKYQIKQIDTGEKYVYSSQISNNEQYLAYGYDRTLKIYDIKSDMIFKELLQDEFIYVCQFTSDSSQIYIGSEKYVYGYNILKNFKQNFKQFINKKYPKDYVVKLRTIKNQCLIVHQKSNTIIKTDIKRNKQIFILNHIHLSTIDFDERDEVLVSGSNKNSIQLWDSKNRRIIINKLQSHNFGIQQIQLIEMNQCLLSIDSESNLYKWRIDFIRKDLIKIQEFQFPDKIISFYQINNDQNLLIIGKKSIQTLDQRGKLINTIYQEADNFIYFVNDPKQLDNVQHIHIRSLTRILLASSVD